MAGKSGNDGDKPLSAYIEEAKKDGTTEIDTPDGSMYLIAPKRRAATLVEPSPYADADTDGLLEQPQSRAAYSDRTAWLMATLSQLAYLPFEKDQTEHTKLVAALGEAGLVLRETITNEDTGTQAFIAERPRDSKTKTGGFRVLAFRGTEKNGKDIITDINARFYETPHGRAHKGFTKAYESVREDIVAALPPLPHHDDNEKLFITGHSLGGALATVATQDLEDTHLVSACYTYGSPRVGVPEWSDCVKAPIYRVVNGADAVPLVPGGMVMRWVLTVLPNIPFLAWSKGYLDKFTKSGFVGFQHAGDMRFLMGGLDAPKLKIGSAAAGARIKYIVIGKIAAAAKAMSPKALTSTVTDHSIALYAGKLRKIAQDRKD